MGFRSLLSPQTAQVAPTSSVPQNLPIHTYTRKPAPVVRDYEADEAQHQEDEMGGEPAISSKVANSLFDANPSGGVTWWQIPAGLTLGAGGLAGGWKGLDALMSSKHQGDVNSDLDEAKREYEQALQDQFLASPAGSKTAADQPYEGLDELFDALEKRGGIELGYEMPNVGEMVSNAVPTGVKDFAHGAGGGYAAAALLSALGSGYAGYQWGKKRSKSKQISDALNRRARERMNPMPLYATADPVEV